jgi:hypothetical protein
MLLWPVALWLLLMNAIKIIPDEGLPEIDIITLPSMDRYLTGRSFLFRCFSYDSDLFAVVASIPYLLHFLLPFIFVYFFQITEECQVTAWWRIKVFVWSFAIVNMLGVVTQLYFPTAPPWWYELRLTKASYEIQGSEAILERVDSILPFPIFSSIYGQSPIVFGSFPSLHAAWPFHIAFFTWKFGILFKIFWMIYIGWLWWAAIYLKHHFLTDIIGAILYVLFVQLISRAVFKKPNVYHRENSSLLPLNEKLK